MERMLISFVTSLRSLSERQFKSTSFHTTRELSCRLIDKEQTEKGQDEIRKTFTQEIELKQQTTSNDNFQTQIKSLRKDKTQLQSQISSLGWDLLNSTCYNFAISGAIESRSWGEARKDCLSHGADLVVVDSWEKQMDILSSTDKTNNKIQLIEVGLVMLSALLLAVDIGVGIQNSKISEKYSPPYQNLTQIRRY
ncbi:unnamed protein product [Coregonus sp. 'balchen']|nr:unnamed protein product [Coregonus sp. 'balchen']